MPDGFTFALKLPREITHERRLQQVDQQLALFCDRARILGPKLGPILVQCPPDFAPAERAVLGDFLEQLPSDLRFAVEFRQSAWLTDDALALLKARGVALVVVDGPWIKRTVDRAIHPTADFAYVRWLGSRRRRTAPAPEDVDRQLSVWAMTLAAVAARVPAVYGYFSNSFQGHAPASARALQSMIGQKPVEPAHLGPQGSLF